MTVTAGLDVGSSTLKIAIWDGDAQEGEVLTTHAERLRRRDVKAVIPGAYQAALASAGLGEDDVEYIATTGEGDLVEFRRGHFYSMTAHARGGVHLVPEARAVLDVGALHGKAIKMDGRGKVLTYRMTSQCASGSGQFVENISRYLGVALDEVGPLSRSADDPETCSNICAVLAETDVINMVSRGISIPNILKGIHLSMAGRLVKLLKASRSDGIVVMTGGLAQDDGLVAAISEIVQDQELPFEVRPHPQSIHAGAIGAAIFGAFRHEVLAARTARA
ncbi:MAG: benzoyl-CoA reductase subunit D [Planctomycetes bacterium]|nr:benzoyl-CoA reductase subunit D [Planctomycetota bacterium]